MGIKGMKWQNAKKAEKAIEALDNLTEELEKANQLRAAELLYAQTFAGINTQEYANFLRKIYKG